MSDTFPDLLTHFEQFLTLFEQLKTIAGEPERLATFYEESSAIRDAAAKLEQCAIELVYNLDWFGSKRLGPVAGFEQAWKDYQDLWAPAIAYGSFYNQLGNRFRKEAWWCEQRKHSPYNPDDWRKPIRPELEEPDPKRDEFFDPVRHDGGLALTLGIDHWRGEVHKANLIANKCQIALDAFDYLVSVIGIDINDVFRRWRELPPIFMPLAIANKDGQEAGSLSDLLDNAVRAYVCGAPAAAIAMCRAVLEMVIKEHYVTDPADKSWTDKSGKKREKGLGDLVVLAEKRFEHLRPLKLSALKDAGDEILHRYHRRERLSASDEKAIVDNMQTLKTLIQRVQG